MLENKNINEAETPQLNIGAVMGSKIFTLTYDELHLLLKEAYRNGYATYEMTDAGLEPYDAEGYARWALLGVSMKKDTSGSTNCPNVG